MLRFVTLFGLAAALVSACGSDAPTDPDDAGQITDDGRSYWPEEAWRTASPADVRMDRARLDALVQRIRSRQIADLHGLIVIRNGYVVLEEYANGSSAAQLHEMQSVTKSVASLVTGIAVDQGKIPGLGTNALDLFPEYSDAQNMDERKRAVTVESLLTMRSGINFHENPYVGSPLQQLNDSRGDWLRLIFDQPMNASPGDLWQYNGGGVIALGGMVFNTSGLAADEFARRHLFEPIGVTSTSWFKGKPNGLPHLGGGLALRLRDLARVGYLVLRKGKWAGTQVVSEDWIRRSTSHHVRNPRTFGSHVTDYGYLWWLLPVDNRSSDSWDTDIITASGARGQWLFIVPKHDLLVAVTSGAPGFTGFLEPVEFLYSHILPAVIQYRLRPRVRVTGNGVLAVQ